MISGHPGAAKQILRRAGFKGPWHPVSMSRRATCFGSRCPMSRGATTGAGWFRGTSARVKCRVALHLLRGRGCLQCRAALRWRAAARGLRKLFLRNIFATTSRAGDALFRNGTDPRQPPRRGRAGLWQTGSSRRIELTVHKVNRSSSASRAGDARSRAMPRAARVCVAPRDTSAPV